MKLKWITLVPIVLFGLIVVYFVVAGELFYNPKAKPSPAALQTELKAIKNGVFEPSKPAIVH